MNTPEFIALQVRCINDSGFGLEQIQQSVIQHIFSEFIGIATIDKMIRMCMEVYSEIIKISELEKEIEKLKAVS